MLNGKTNFCMNLFREMRIIAIDARRDVVDSLTDSSKVYDNKLAAVMTFNEELRNLGYTLNMESIMKLAFNGDAIAMQNILSAVKTYIGKVDAKPMYPDFPSYVMNMGEAEFRFHQIMHYFSTYGMEFFTGLPISKGWLPDVDDTEKTVEDKSLLDLKVVSIESLEYAIEDSFKRLLSKRERLTIPEAEIIKYDIENLPDSMNGWYNTIDIAFKENMYDIFYTVFTSNRFNVSTNYKFCQHTGDVWKCINYLMNEKGIKHFRTSQKRALVKLLESYPEKDFLENLIISNKSAEKVKVLLKYLDYNKYSRNDHFKCFVSMLRNNELTSWEGTAKKLIFDHDPEALAYIAKRPGMFLRMLTLLYRNGYSYDDIYNIIYNKKNNICKSLSTQTIVTLLNYFYSENGITLFDNETPRDMNELFKMRDILKTILIENIGAKEIPELTDKKVYLDFDNYNLELSNIECNEKSEEGGYIRSGLAYKIPDDVHRLRFFVYWNDKNRVDIDLHGYMTRKDNRTRDAIGWNKDFRNDISVFSGDITHSDAAEFIDINLDKDVYTQVSTIINIYSGKSCFKDIDECFVGMMAVEDWGKQVKLYNPKNCFFTHYLKGNSRCLEYCHIDIKNRCIFFIGKQATTKSFSSCISEFSVKEYINILLSTHNSIVVENKEDADTILTMEKPKYDNALSLLENNFFMDL